MILDIFGSEFSQYFPSGGDRNTMEYLAHLAHPPRPQGAELAVVVGVACVAVTGSSRASAGSLVMAQMQGGLSDGHITK